MLATPFGLPWHKARLVAAPFNPIGTLWADRTLEGTFRFLKQNRTAVGVTGGKVARLQSLYARATRQGSGLPSGQVILPCRMRRVRLKKGTFDE